MAAESRIASLSGFVSTFLTNKLDFTKTIFLLFSWPLSQQPIWARVFFCLKVDGPTNGGGVRLIRNSFWFTDLWVVCYTAIFSVAPLCIVTLQDDTKNSCVADYSAYSTTHCQELLSCPLKHSIMAVTSKILSTVG